MRITLRRPRSSSSGVSPTRRRATTVLAIAATATTLTTITITAHADTTDSTPVQTASYTDFVQLATTVPPQPPPAAAAAAASKDASGKSGASSAAAEKDVSAQSGDFCLDPSSGLAGYYGEFAIGPCTDTGTQGFYKEFVNTSLGRQLVFRYTGDPTQCITILERVWGQEASGEFWYYFGLRPCVTSAEQLFYVEAATPGNPDAGSKIVSYNPLSLGEYVCLANDGAVRNCGNPANLQKLYYDCSTGSCLPYYLPNSEIWRVRTGTLL